MVPRCTIALAGEIRCPFTVSLQAGFEVRYCTLLFIQLGPGARKKVEDALTSGAEDDN